MAARERPFDRGSRLGSGALRRIGEELREARTDRGLSVDSCAAALRISNAEVSRIERGLSPKAPFVTLARFAAVVGLDLSARLFPGASPVRDAAQVQLLADFRSLLHRSLRWAIEVPMPIPGDQRAWDAMISGRDWRFGVEAETLPRDAQALVRRVQLKQRDGAVDGVLIALRDTRRTRLFLRAAVDELQPAFPVPDARAVALLAAGASPGGNAMILVPRSRSPVATPPRPREPSLIRPR